MVAKAPYNFVSLNDHVVRAQDIPDFNKYHENMNSGYIELSIKTLTPLYIGDKKEDSEFFNIGGNPKIPGSSIRGMIRTLVEIVSYGKFKFFDDKRLYYRAIGDGSSLGRSYRHHFQDGKHSDQNVGLSLKVHSGIMKKNGNKYVIYPSRKINGIQYYRIGNFEIDVNPRHFQVDNITVNLFDFQEIYFKTVNESIHSHRNGRIFLKYALVKEISDTPLEGYKKGYLRSSGYIKDKYMQWIINEPEDRSIDVKETVIKEYEQDSGRIQYANILNEIENCSDGVPVFYLLNRNEDVLAFGHTGFFRLPYSKTIGEHVPDKLKSDDIIDFAEAIFGLEGKWLSRVFFEDAKLLDDPTITNIYLSVTSPKILSAPKPTTFQHYLEQPAEANRSRKNLKHWNDDVKIRGYKLYWHRDAPDNPNSRDGIYCWNEGRIIRDSQHSIIEPIKRNVKFKSRIRFENLTDEELGCLLFTLDLPKNCCHKLGMGKPLGLGSIEIKAKLFVINRKKRYESLFNININNDYWNEAKEKKDIDHFKKKFEKYILRKISRDQENYESNLWNDMRLKHLKTMLNWKNTEKANWLKRTHYLDLVDFKERKILPSPEKVDRS